MYLVSVTHSPQMDLKNRNNTWYVTKAIAVILS